MSTRGGRNNNNNRGRARVVKGEGRKARRSAYKAKKREEAAASSAATTTKVQAFPIPAATMAGQTVGGSANVDVDITGGDPSGLGGGVGAGAGAGAVEEVPPPEGLPVPSRAELMALLEAALAENDALRTQQRAGSRPRGEGPDGIATTITTTTKRPNDQVDPDSDLPDEPLKKRSLAQSSHAVDTDGDLKPTVDIDSGLHRAVDTDGGLSAGQNDEQDACSDAEELYSAGDYSEGVVIQLEMEQSPLAMEMGGTAALGVLKSSIEMLKATAYAMDLDCESDMRTDMTKDVGFDKYWDACGAVTPDEAAQSLESFIDTFDISKTGEFGAPRGPGDIGTAEVVLGKDLSTPLQLQW